MKKILFALAVLFGCSTVGFTQTNFIATLQHEGEFVHFYGAGALTAAYNAAEKGDIITLSPGTFLSPGTINKSITLRGTGIETEDSTYSIGLQNLTFVSGVVTFQNTDSSNVIIVEGIRFLNKVKVENNNSGNGQGQIKFLKNYMESFEASKANTYSEESGPKIQFYNNIISDLVLYTKSFPNIHFYNCFVKDPRWDGDASETIVSFLNCVIKWGKTRINYTGNYSAHPYRERAHFMNFYNCIFNNAIEPHPYTFVNNVLPNTATCYNCLSINEGSLFNNIVSGSNNKTVENISNIFVTYSADPEWREYFELTTVAMETYNGTDGTQIGMQGGNYPYTTTVQYPIITKFYVDSQTNKEGNLNIEVKVDGK